MNSRLFSYGLLVVFLGIFIFFSYGSALRESLTYDEIVDVEEGYRNLTKHEFAEPYNLPLVRELQIAPIVFGLRPLPTTTQEAFPARAITIFLGVLLILLVYGVSVRYFGNLVGLVAAFLLVFEPNILANSHYVTFDTAFALFFVLGWAGLLYVLEKPYLKAFLIFGVALGLLFATRILAIPYFVLSVMLLLLTKKRHSMIMLLSTYKGHVGLSIFITFFIIWMTYFIKSDVIIARRPDSGRLSSRLEQQAKDTNNAFLTNVLLFLKYQPLPLGNYLATVKNSVLRSQAGESNPWYLMLINIMYKTPLPLIMLFGFSVVTFIKNKQLSMLAPYLVPIVGILLVATIARFSPWVRYVLPIYPFVALVSAVGITEVKGVYRRLAIGGLLVWYLLGTWNQFPHFISYANGLVGPRESRYLMLTDSNIDWGQGLIDLGTFIKETKPSHLTFSYFGRDNGNNYGLLSNRPWGSYKFEDICTFHEIDFPQNKGTRVVAISISNWHGCGFSKDPRFQSYNVAKVVGDSILIFSL